MPARESKSKDNAAPGRASHVTDGASLAGAIADVVDAMAVATTGHKVEPSLAVAHVMEAGKARIHPGLATVALEVAGKRSTRTIELTG